jgi:hypothetical protein
MCVAALPSLSACPLFTHTHTSIDIQVNTVSNAHTHTQIHVHTHQRQCVRTPPAPSHQGFPRAHQQVAAAVLVLPQQCQGGCALPSVIVPLHMPEVQSVLHKSCRRTMWHHRYPTLLLLLLLLSPLLLLLLLLCCCCPKSSRSRQSLRCSPPVWQQAEATRGSRASGRVGGV